MLVITTGFSNDIILILSVLVLILFIFYLCSYKFLRKILFLFEPEFIHKISFHFLKIIFLLPKPLSFWKYFLQLNDDRLKKEVFGISFDNPVGLAAGFDKDAEIFDGLSSFGFGFVEIGTVTPLAQDGNPKPRLFRLKDDYAVINRMGFNNDGVEAITSRLRRKKSKIIVGGNIGKNKLTPNESAISDYVICFEKLFDHVDYFVVNVSSPNTPGLRDLQEKEPLTKLLNHLQKINNSKSRPKPILLKIAPDLTNTQLDDIVDIIKETRLNGVVATNTTINRDNLKTDKLTVDKVGNGGLSGRPLKDRSTEVIKYLSKKSNKSFSIIGVGGISSSKDAIEKLEAGADLIQIYTGFIYEGPFLVKKINKDLINMSSL